MAELVGLIASIIQLADTVVKACTYAKDCRDAPKQQLQLLAEVQSLQPLLEDLKTRVQHNLVANGIQQLQHSLGPLEEMMNRLVEKLRFTDKRFSQIAKQLTWALDKKEVKEDLDRIEHFKGLLNTWLTMDIWDAALQQQENHTQILKLVTETSQTVAHTSRGQGHILSEVRDVQQQRDAADREKVIEWLSPLNPFLRHADVFSTAQKGTGQWLLQDARFASWLASFGGTLWCAGIPGAGKTVLSSIVTDHLRMSFARNENIGVACLYLNHKESDAQSPPNLLASVWWQLIVDQPVGSQVHTLYRHHHDRRTRPSLDEVHELLRLAVARYSKVYIVVDAMDEYPEKQRSILLSKLSALGVSVNLMLTARPHINVDPSLPHVQTVEISASEHDIRQYVDAEISKSTRLSKHVRNRPELRDEIEEKIIHNADGMFLLAKLCIDSLSTKLTVKAVRDTLSNLPKDLKQTYDEVMDRINRQNEDDRDIALLALTWVVNAKRPLSVSEFLEALAIEPGATALDPDNLLDIEFVVSVCAGLITVDEADQIVRLVHYTAQNYLDGVQASQFPWAQIEITWRCLTYLCFDSFLELPQYWMLRQKFLVEHALLAYAARYCLVHAAGQPEGEPYVRNMLIAFLEQAHRWLSSFELKDDKFWWPKSPSKLWFSAFFNLKEVARHLVMLGMAIQEVDNPLAPASFRGHLDIIQIFIESGVDVNMEESGKSALQVASASGQESAARLLIDNGAEINALGFYGTALLEAIDNGHEPIARLLIENGADVTGLHARYVHMASLSGQESVVQLLIANGADIHLVDEYYGSALQAASQGGHESVARLLIEKGAKINAPGGIHGNALQLAFRNGNASVARLLIEHGADISVIDKNALHVASESGDELLILLLIEVGTDLDAWDGSGRNALILASRSGHESIVRLLVVNGADVTAQDKNGESALQVALCNNHESIARILIENGADLDAWGDYGNALMLASLYGHETIVRFLIENGVDVNAHHKKSGTALQEAARVSHESIVRLLLENGADVNVQGGIYGTALQVAVEANHESVVRLLIEHGADVNMQGGIYGTALQAAVKANHESLVRLLIEHGADVNAHSGTALQAAVATYNANESLVRLLIEQGADVNMQGGIYGTALQAAVEANHESLVRLLIENGADVNGQGGKYGTALQAAVATHHADSLVQLLIEHGADVNVQGGIYGTALQAAAAYRDNESLVRLLIKHGADVNAHGGKYGTALQAVAANHHADSLVQLLIEHGADPNARGEFGSALILASYFGKDSIVSLLIEHGADVNAPGGIYGDALQAASRRRHESVVQLLLEHGAVWKQPAE
ncbi:ankyrin repeat-containing domain protein [Mycena rebaudengoi]|nr:ankyrin repeat-containing domain protein [Mycena rebaudengoi]